MRFLLAILTLCLFTTSFAQSFSPTKVQVALQHVYVPQGFDDNDSVQLVGEGIFSSSCFRYAGTAVDVNTTDKIIRLSTMAYQYGGICIQLVLPFDHVIDIGILPKGTYSIVLDDNKKQVGTLDIKASTRAEPDENLYAPISQALMQTKDGQHKVTLTGMFPSSCMTLSHVETHMFKDALILQPIAEMGSANCQDGQFPFETEVDLGTVKPGRYLLHVRSMNGKSINSLVDIPNR